MLFELEVKVELSGKTVAFIVLLVLTSSAVAVTSPMPEKSEDGWPLNIVSFTRSLFRPVFARCDPIGGGPGGGGD